MPEAAPAAINPPEDRSAAAGSQAPAALSPIGGIDGFGGAPLESLARNAREFIRAAKAENSRRAYLSDWRLFEAWCRERRLPSLPATPETVTLYITALAANHKPASLQRKLTSITKAHQAAGYESPASMQRAVVGETMKGIRRTLGTAQPGKEALLTADLLEMLDSLDDGLIGCRDRALLLAGFAGGFRRSELAALDVADVTETEDGLVIRVRRSKTDPEGKGTSVALPYGSAAATCPVRSYRAWIAAAGLTDGPAFRAVDRHGRVSPGRMDAGSIARIVKRAAAAAGLDPAAYAGHSLRAGFATQAFLNGVSEVSIMRQTRHKSLATLRKYIHDRSLFRDNPARSWGCRCGLLGRDACAPATRHIDGCPSK
jgi:site-specific recombinase XerD